MVDNQVKEFSPRILSPSETIAIKNYMDSWIFITPSGMSDDDMSVKRPFIYIIKEIRRLSERPCHCDTPYESKQQVVTDAIRVVLSPLEEFLLFSKCPAGMKSHMCRPCNMRVGITHIVNKGKYIKAKVVDDLIGICNFLIALSHEKCKCEGCFNSKWRKNISTALVGITAYSEKMKYMKRWDN